MEVAFVAEVARPVAEVARLWMWLSSSKVWRLRLPGLSKVWRLRLPTSRLDDLCTYAAGRVNLKQQRMSQATIDDVNLSHATRQRR